MGIAPTLEADMDTDRYAPPGAGDVDPEERARQEEIVRKAWESYGDRSLSASTPPEPTSGAPAYSGMLAQGAPPPTATPAATAEAPPPSATPQPVQPARPVALPGSAPTAQAPDDGVVDLAPKTPSRFYAPLAAQFPGIPTKESVGSAQPPQQLSIDTPGGAIPFNVAGYSTEVKLPGIYDPASGSTLPPPSAYSAPAHIDPEVMRATMQRMNEIGLLRQGFARNPTGWELQNGTPNKPVTSDAWDYAANRAQAPLVAAKSAVDRKNEIIALMNKVAGEGYQAQLAGVKAGAPFARAAAQAPGQALQAGVKAADVGAQINANKEIAGARIQSSADIASKHDATRLALAKMGIEGVNLTPEALDLAATLLAKNGTQIRLSPKAGGAQQAKVLDAAAKKLGGADPTGVRAGVKADTASLTKLQQQYDAVTAFERTARTNLETARRLMSTLPDTGSPWLNTHVRQFQKNIMGDPQVSAANAALYDALTEAARVIRNPNLSGILPVEDSRAVHDLLTIGGTPKQALAVIDTVGKNMAARSASIGEQLATAKARISAPLPGDAQKQGGPPPTQLQTVKVSPAIDPTGKVAAKLKAGGRVFVVGGRLKGAAAGQPPPPNAEKEIVP
jgi:hypothetical protein